MVDKMRLNRADNKGTLIEKYVSTEPVKDPRASRGYQEAQIGFGWTNGVYLEAFLMLQML